MKILKGLLMIITAPVILVLTLFVWLCSGLIYISGLVLGLLSIVIALLGVAVLITYSLQNGVILLVMAFLISPMGLPLAAIWLLGKVVCKNLQHFFKGQHLFSLLCYTAILFHIIRYGQSKDKDTGKKKKRREVRRRNAFPPSANGVPIPVMKVWKVG